MRVSAYAESMGRITGDRTVDKVRDYLLDGAADGLKRQAEAA